MKISVERNKGNNYSLILHRKRNTETDIKWSLLYGTAPGIRITLMNESMIVSMIEAYDVVTCNKTLWKGKL